MEYIIAIIVIIVLVALAIYLFQQVWFWIFIGIGAVIALICFLIYKAHVSAQNQKAEKVRIEQQRIQDIENKMVGFNRRYSVDLISQFRISESFSAPSKYVLNEVNRSVGRCVERLCPMVDNHNDIKKTIDDILSCNTIQGADEKYQYLLSQESRLDSLKKASDSLNKEINKIRVQLINIDKERVAQIASDFYSILKSKKVVFLNELMRKSSFIDRPKEHDSHLFIYDAEPVCLCVCNHRFLIFNTVILVFNANGDYCTALDISALRVNINKLSAKVSVLYNRRTYNREPEYTDYVAKDSKVLNSSYSECTLEYGKVDVSIANMDFSFFVSSEKAINSIIHLSKLLSELQVVPHDYILDFLNLLKTTTETREKNVKRIIETRKKQIADENHYCKETIN